MTGRRITFVKKILADGQPCAKCQDVETRLRADHQWRFIDRVVIADERNPDSEGMQIAAQYGVERAPFFVIRNSENTTIYTVYLKFIKEVLGESNDTTEAQLLLSANPELDLL